MIHELSRRSVANFQAVNCAALPDTLFESEIFGYEKGAFTGAHDRKPGRLELANEGTLFLDEIGDMSLIAQAKLLRVLEERKLRTARRQQGHLRRLPADLGHQPAARPVRPRQPLSGGPLLSRQRVCDSPAVAARASGGHPGPRRNASSRASARRRACRSTARPSRARPSTCCSAITGPATSASSKAPCRARRCRRPDASFAAPTSNSFTRRWRRRSPRATGCRRWREAERAHIVRVLEAVQWNKKEAARVLEISRGTLYRKIEDVLSSSAEPRTGRPPRPRHRLSRPSPASARRSPSR